MDKAHRQTDVKIAEIQKHIEKIYKKVIKDLINKGNLYFINFEKQDKEMQKKVKDKKITKKEYIDWRKKEILTGNKWQKFKENVSKELFDINKKTVEYINGEMPSIYVNNYNYIGKKIEKEIDEYSFENMNENYVNETLKKDKNKLTKSEIILVLALIKTLNASKDKKWNVQNINSVLMQGIIKGESFNKVSKNLKKIGNMNKNSAIKILSSLATSTEGKARYDSMKTAQKKGVVLQKKWIAVNDAKTRSWHSDLSGQIKNIDEPFENDYGEIMFPGDPTAHPGNTYNCRCELIPIIKGYKGK